ncbi:Yqey-like protein-domain-containing protein [Protomyces lactucae-debilis]|uniref:Altered inheritance of mitochondria protein 41 n=1 Tax=Protomyces lactucae-debilis TaxID=2754530 RepID=A0A1Y2FIG9_PROLT|nr:Yqey-like protein-domain-containing protein [Protomyces lactucae-debilis]ORY82615.1 Yqey-like protein-domain-containing protein [Protomyces lactucae-debilis]
MMGYRMLAGTLARQARRYSTSTGPQLLLTLKEAVKQSMRNKDKPRLNVCKDILAQVVNASKTNKPVETDVQVINLLRSSAAKRREAAAAYRQHGRAELAEVEELEAGLLDSFLPKQMDEGVLQAQVVALVSRMQATPKEMGKVLKALAEEVDESAAPKAMQARIVKQVLAGASTAHKTSS